MGEGEQRKMRCYNLASQMCGAGSEQHSKPLFLVKGKPDLGMLKSNVIEGICAGAYYFFNPHKPRGLSERLS